MSPHIRRSPIRPASSAYLGFVFFGGLWGTWGAAIPAVRDQADVSEGQLGTALLFVGAGALPAMLAAGKLVDRYGHRAAGSLLMVLGLGGLAVAVTSKDFATLSVSLTALGAASGATDVAINAAAGSAQHASGRPVISRAHAAFSAGVVVASLVTGILLGIGLPLVTPFAVMAAVGGVVGYLVARSVPALAPAGEELGSPPGRAKWSAMPLLALLTLGALGALAFAVENGHQSWSALYLRDTLHAPPASAALGPAVFATIVALTRLTTADLGTRRPLAVLLAGATAAALGTAGLAAAATLVEGLVALGLAAAGTAVLFPTLLNVLTTHVSDEVRGTATSMVTTVAYLGFLGGPPYVGLLADAIGLPGAMFALAAVAALLAIAGPVALRHGPLQPQGVVRDVSPAVAAICRRCSAGTARGPSETFTDGVKSDPGDAPRP